MRLFTIANTVVSPSFISAFHWRVSDTNPTTRLDCCTAHPALRLLCCNLTDFMRGMIAINQLIYVVIWPNSETPYVRPTVSTPATSTKTPASLGRCLIFARLVSLRAGTHTRGAPTGLAIHSALPRQQFTPRWRCTSSSYTKQPLCTSRTDGTFRDRGRTCYRRRRELARPGRDAARPRTPPIRAGVQGCTSYAAARWRGLLQEDLLPWLWALPRYRSWLPCRWVEEPAGGDTAAVDGQRRVCRDRRWDKVSRAKVASKHAG